MPTDKNALTGRERFFDESEIIVSKTDLTGKITYANRTFLKVAGLTENECFGKPHSIIRNPDMPRCVFQLLWDTIQSGKELFAYVNNRAVNGDHYWVFAHVTPSRNEKGEITGYHSNRRVPNRSILDKHIIPLYQDLLRTEQAASDTTSGIKNSYSKVKSLLAERNMGFNEFMFSLGS